MLRFTDIFIKRPVLAVVLSLLILLLGLRAMLEMPLRQYPKMDNTVISVSTAYPGAAAQLMSSFITAPLESAIAGADGIDYLSSESAQGISTITAHIKLNYDPEIAFTNIMSKVNQVSGELPEQSDKPIIEKDTGSHVALMYISYSSHDMNAQQMTDYILRVVQPKLQTISGVASAQVLGGSNFALRVWLETNRLAALGITPGDVRSALQSYNIQAAAGNTKGSFTAININARTDLQSLDEFKDIPIKQEANTIVRLKDVARVELGAENYDSSVTFNGKKAIFVAIQGTPTANPLTVISDLRKELPDIQKAFPPALQQSVVYDATQYIRSSIHEVVMTIIEASLIVILVIYAFLGSLRTVIIPVITIPLSLVGVCAFMLFLGYSINLLTLLAMVLAIGMVVDDAIVVVENIYRHIEEGQSPLDSALLGAREIAMPVISMTITLAAVYAPIGFMTGITGALFTEFAFTLAGAVIISGVVALSLSPMMCSKVLSAHLSQDRYVHFIDAKFNRLREIYQAYLREVLDARKLTLSIAALILVSCYFLYASSTKELAPTEDQSVLFTSMSAPSYANIDYLERFSQQIDEIFKKTPEMQDYFLIKGMGAANSGFGGMILKPWDQRKKSQEEVLAGLEPQLNEIAGLQIYAFPLPALPSSGHGLPIDFELTSIGDFKDLFKVAEQLKIAAQNSGLFIFVSNSLQFDTPQYVFHFDRNKAAVLGVSMADVAQQLAGALGENYVNRFNLQGRSYKVIQQLERASRDNPDIINQLQLKTQSGELIPLSAIVSVTREAQPNSLTRFQQLNSAAIVGMLMPGKTIGEGLDYLQKEAAKLLKPGMGHDYGGESRQFMQEGNSLMLTFAFSLLVIFLVLAAQFESFRDPIIILISVPMSICGALIPLNLGLATINVYTQIGLVTLVGLISKHGILIVEFANQLQREEGLSIRDAVIKATGVRLRAILMTTAAMVVGVLPLILAEGAGAHSRFNIGLVIASGMLIGTVFTLFMVPTMYCLLATKRSVTTGSATTQTADP